MKKIILVLCSLIACLTMNAQANLQINDFSIKAGEKKTITLNLVNPDTEVSGFNCIIMLCEGITIDKKNNGKYNISFNTDADRAVSHSILTGEKNGGISLVVISLDADELVGQSGDPVLDIHITASANIEPGIYQIKVAEQDIVNCMGTVSYKPEDYICTVNVEGTGTGINDVYADSANAIYNLNGQKLNKVEHGINIVNGKKTLVK